MLNVPSYLKAGNGAILLNDNLGSIRGTVLVPAAQGITIPAGGGNTPGTATPQFLEAPSDGWCDLQSLVGFYSAATAANTQRRCLVQIQDILTVERKLSNKPVPIEHVFGNQKNPMYLEQYAEGLLMQDLQVMTFLFSNPTLAAATFSFMSSAMKFQTAARQMPPIAQYLDELNLRRRKICPYWFAPDQQISIGQPGVTLAASGRGLLTYTNYLRADIVLTEVMATAITSGVAGDVNEKITFSIQDQRTDRNLQNQPVSLNCFAGDAQFPYVLPVPIRVENNGILTVNLQNLVTDATTDVLLTFFGIRVDGGNDL